MFEEYIDQENEIWKQIDLKELETAEKAIIQCYQNNKSIYILGNGGSASTASHWVCDIGKIAVDGKKRFSISSMTDNNAWCTAISNDIGFDMIFLEQLKNLLIEGDLVIGISASGKSQNVINAVLYAREVNAVSLSIVGFSGGSLRTLSDYCIYIPSYNYGIVEDIQLSLGHMLSQEIKRKLTMGEL